MLITAVLRIIIASSDSGIHNIEYNPHPPASLYVTILYTKVSFVLLLSNHEYFNKIANHSITLYYN